MQAQGHGVLLVASGEGSVDLPGRDGAGAGAADAGPALLAADVSVAPVVPGRAPSWGADLVTGPGLADACRIVAATAAARTLSRQCVETALTGNVLGGLLASVGSAERGQRRATRPGKSATALNHGLGCLVGAAGRRPPRAGRHRAHAVARPGPGPGAAPGRRPSPRERTADAAAVRQAAFRP